MARSRRVNDEIRRLLEAEGRESIRRDEEFQDYKRAMQSLARS